MPFKIAADHAVTVEHSSAVTRIRTWVVCGHNAEVLTTIRSRLQTCNLADAPRHLVGLNPAACANRTKFNGPSLSVHRLEKRHWRRPNDSTLLTLARSYQATYFVCKQPVAHILLHCEQIEIKIAALIMAVTESLHALPFVDQAFRTWVVIRPSTRSTKPLYDHG